MSNKSGAARIDFRYPGGIEVHVKFPAWASPPRGPSLGAVFVGERCKIEINRNKFVTNPPDFIPNPPDPALAKKWEGDGWVAKGHVENWFDCIKSRSKPNADVEIGHRTVTIAHLTNIAASLAASCAGTRGTSGSKATTKPINCSTVLAVRAGNYLIFEASH